MKRVAACTVFAANFAAMARVLRDSFHQFHPEIPFHMLLVGTKEEAGLLGGESAGVLGLHELRIPGLWKMLLRYERKQVLTALKPALIRFLLEQGYESVLFLDADLQVLATLDPVLQVVAEHSLTLTPHVGPAFALTGTPADAKPLLLAGVNNTGVVGVTNREESRRFVNWWEGRLRSHCLEDVRNGFHFDQRWADLAMGFVEDLHLLRDPGVNVAYWNLSQVKVRETPEGCTADGAPLRLFHFSGYSPARPEFVTRHIPGLRINQMGEAAELFRRYASLLEAAGWADVNERPWPWDGLRHQCRRVAAQWHRWRRRHEG
jgi:hypothetical protein